MTHLEELPVSRSRHFAALLALAASACTPSTDPEALTADAGLRRIVVVNSDYRSMSASLVDGATGALVRDDCMNSGTAQPAPALSLSGDVVPPSAPQAGGELALIDRGNATVTWVDPSTCSPARQLAVGRSGDASFKSLPQDLLSVSPTKAYVIRMGKNPAPSAQPDDFDEGDDVLIIDPSIPAATGRIDLSGEAIPAATGEVTQAMPGIGVVVGRLAYITIASYQAGYKKAGTGRVTIIDTDTDAIVGRIDLPEYKGCRQLTVDPARTRLVVGCAGLYADGATRVGQSGFVAFDLSVSPPAPSGGWAPALFGGRAVALERNAQLLSATRGVTVVPGESKSTPTDGLWLFDGATATKLLESTTSFDFGPVLYDQPGHRLYFTDAAAALPRLRSLDLASSPPSELPATEPNPSGGLPPRYLSWY
jgi:hypothetical protein